MYKITATILKPGGLPVEWTCMSKERLTSTQCEKKFSQVKEAGKTAEERVLVKNFKCVSLPRKRKVAANGK
jgi:antisense regulator of RalR protein